MAAEEQVLALAVQDRERLGPSASPVLLELVEIPVEGMQEARLYWLRCYRVDEEGELPGGWPFFGIGPRCVEKARESVRVRWMEATLRELPDGVFGEGVSAS